MHVTHGCGIIIKIFPSNRFRALRGGLLEREIMDEKPRILVVDDEPINRRVLEAMLIPLGYEVFLAQDGPEALEQVYNNMPDLILLDVMMPGMDGFEVCRKLKSKPGTKPIPVVIVTALREVEDRVKALEAGADDFLTKPVDKTEMRARVRSLLKVKAYHDHLMNYQQELEWEVAERTEDLEHALNKIKSSSLDTIMRLSKAAEYKDEDTGAHILRMSNYSAVVARQMGLSEAVQDAILYAAPMHDVGKIGIPDSVLLKPGSLNDQEWTIMKSHTTIGANILSNSDPGFLRLAEVVAVTHHERWDGTGYPNGLKGREIPLAGRITAIADVFDALTSRRPYKEPFPIGRSLDIIKESRGSHFDPRVVDAFFEVLEDDILVIREQYLDVDEDQPLVVS